METQDKFLTYLNREIFEWTATKDLFTSQGKLVQADMVESKLSLIKTIREVYKSHL